jgi:transcription antitermination factor NusG
MLEPTNYDNTPTALHGTNPRSSFDADWYAAYVCARHEKKVAGQLEQKGVECFLPLYQSVHRWKDRFKKVELPLFPSYIFVRMHAEDRLRVLQMSSVVRFVSFNGSPAALSSPEIETLRNGLSSDVCLEPHPYLVVGRRVRVIHGPLTGLEGVIQRKKDRLRIVISIDMIMRSVAAEVNAVDLEWLPKNS